MFLPGRLGYMLEKATAAKEAFSAATCTKALHFPYAALRTKAVSSFHTNSEVTVGI